MGRPLGKKNFGPLGSTTSTTGYPDTGDGRNIHGTNTTSATELRQRGYNIPVYQAQQLWMLTKAQATMFTFYNKKAHVDLR